MPVVGCQAIVSGGATDTWRLLGRSANLDGISREGEREEWAGLE
ncbi:MAG: hypothetical protein WKH68_09320 [Candidatus Limnocylindria bacterium]